MCREFALPALLRFSLSSHNVLICFCAQLNVVGTHLTLLQPRPTVQLRAFVSARVGYGGASFYVLGERGRISTFESVLISRSGLRTLVV